MWSEEKVFDFFKTTGAKLDENTVMISASKNWGLDRLLSLITQKFVSAKIDAL